ncbi:hypothetical protein [Natroniella acetigena]|nr:hypothetical protein [Natroniella acetigena]
MKAKVIKHFEIPKEAETIVDLILSKDEQKLIEFMQQKEYSYA